MSEDRGTLVPEDGGASKKDTGLLKVPSRSSSHHNTTNNNQQSSPTSTGLSGATVNEHRDSIGGRSKDSKGSFLGRQRNGSASSRTAGGNRTTNIEGDSQPSSPIQKRKKKKSGGILSFLGCCAGPDDGNTTEGDGENVHKLQSIPQRPPTAKSKSRTATPQEQDDSNKATNEKDTTATEKNEEQTISGGGGGGGGGRITPVNGESSGQTVAPSVTVEPPKPQTENIEHDHSHNNTTAHDGDAMQDAITEERHGAVDVPATEEYNDSEDVPMQTAPVALPEDIIPDDEPPRYLLPEILPEHRGRKCLVLDLDETLVHSSFKILHQADFTIPVEIEGNYHNVYVIKRPGVDEFMKRVGELYEVVVFTASVSKYGDPLLDQLDIHKVVHHRLFRESCYNHQGNYVKDLSQIGRDLKDTIIIDNSPTSYIFHPQHAVPISSWFSDAHDNELLDLIPVLEDLAGPTVADVSLVLDVTL
ncbi:hypothetical protein GMORB2_1561 [Geosmithia morbida]|uniref:FCP1 homology domain-containing protein n=1 Tax=Geosmithia morbida TaxID=1094350 RepID=A0A9P4YSI6_9HYPO|nr:uncharacterized protein GMORB2_1561 [Geosmithia morbida]KAF4121722.1 hypothetical protein GMORB2_1561 [Geosmithia morbida]